jgi:chromosome segregation ATPase
MSSAKDLNHFSRPDLTRLACDAIASEGKKPSIGLVREWTIQNAGAKKGSDGDVQKDINAWFNDLLRLKRDNAIEGLPDTVTALARDLWRLATDVAAENLASSRREADLQVLAAEARTAVAETRTAGALAQAESISHALAVASESIRRLEASAAENKAIAASTAERHGGQLLARDERIAALVSDLGRKDAERAAGLAELDGLRRHSLMQIETGRGEARHWKTEFERANHENRNTLETYRQKTSTLDTDLAAARGRLGAVEESLAASVLRTSQLELELATAKAAVAGGTIKHKLASPWRKIVVRRQKL